MKAERILGWKRTVTFDDLVREMVEADLEGRLPTFSFLVVLCFDNYLTRLQPSPTIPTTATKMALIPTTRSVSNSLVSVVVLSACGKNPTPSDIGGTRHPFLHLFMSF